MKRNNRKVVTALTVVLVSAFSVTGLAFAATSSLESQPAVADLKVDTSFVDNHIGDMDMILSLGAQEEEPAVPVVEEVALSGGEDWSRKAMVNVAADADVHSDADSDSPVIGKVFSNTSVSVVEKRNDWTHIKSGNLDGYINTAQLTFGKNGELLMKAKCAEIATVSADTAKFYEYPDSASKVRLFAVKDEEFIILQKTKDWYLVELDESHSAYVPANEISTRYYLQDGMTMDEIAAAEEEIRRQEAAAMAAQQAAASQAYQAQQAAQPEAIETAQASLPTGSDGVVDTSSLAAIVGRPSGLNRLSGVNMYDGRKETYYSSQRLYHKQTPNWQLDAEGYYHDPETGAYVVAASDMPIGTVFEGSKGTCIVLDTGCAEGVTDYYVNW